ncbi:MAG: hypothetical protein HFI68_05350 [Lachnospiraceae bacterium]|nr:hypothetical protein [Lachnospiraceae bacterium]
MKTTLYTIFYSTGVYQHRIAGRIFIDAVVMAAEDPFRLTSITANIYEPLARRYHSNVACISKNVRDVRNTIMKNDGAKILMEITGSRRWYAAPPYPNEIIDIFARYIRENHIPYDSL